jgi:hypothetical protein
MPEPTFSQWPAKKLCCADKGRAFFLSSKSGSGNGALKSESITWSFRRASQPTRVFLLATQRLTEGSCFLNY